MRRNGNGFLIWAGGILLVLLMLSNAGWAYVSLDQAKKLRHSHEGVVECNIGMDALLTLAFELGDGATRERMEAVAKAYGLEARLDDRGGLVIDGVHLRFGEQGIAAVEVAAMRKLIEGRRRTQR